ncbi:HypC/HybG/HupF family hydrogenase formation chaperone [Neorhizobium galegae]|uniref:HypC/HybG/HupF family hydrogenase formation chaperone n=1 Tax=Neorhizobium galegae TaxID=399 RepID=A0A6A1TIE3_NEOGA|nr:HypC/HybG/HupF family hydrogenase formation chaperone [Neorhizobium galegae]KAB1083008.1 HypC/HybG/HupF family hydrogenase formation chaperone [Neorhizobium galegae]
MCIGVPHIIIETGQLQARARSRNGEAIVDMALVGDQPVGTHVLVFLGAAREVLDAQLAGQIADALEAMDRIMAGDSDIDHLFADLINREPQLPEHLRQCVTVVHPEEGIH